MLVLQPLPASLLPHPLSPCLLSQSPDFPWLTLLPGLRSQVKPGLKSPPRLHEQQPRQ